jgi:hypothetical protein
VLEPERLKADRTDSLQKGSLTPRDVSACQSPLIVRWVNLFDGAEMGLRDQGESLLPSHSGGHGTRLSKNVFAHTTDQQRASAE